MIKIIIPIHLIYRFNVITQNPATYSPANCFTEIDQADPKILMEIPKNQNSQNNLEKRTKWASSHLLISKQYKATIIRIVLLA